MRVGVAGIWSSILPWILNTEDPFFDFKFAFFELSINLTLLFSACIADECGGSAGVFAKSNSFIGSRVLYFAHYGTTGSASGG